MKHNNSTYLSPLFDTTPQHLTCLSHVVKVFKLSWKKIGSCILLAVQLVTSQVLCHCHKITVHWARSAPCVGFTLSFQKHDCSSSLCLLYTVWGCIAVLKDRTSWHMFMPLPANSLMQSAWRVTANVHIPWYILQIVLIIWSLAAIHICNLTFHVQHYATFLNMFLSILPPQ